MKIKTMKKTYLIIIAILLLFIGIRFYLDFLDYLIPNNGNAQIVSTRLSSQFFEPIYFGLSLAIIPILIMLSWKFATNKVMPSILIILFSTIGFFLRFTMLKFLIIASNDSDLKANLFLEEINFSIYIFFGSLIGFILSILIFKKSKPQS
jgi:hypothetical protein